MHVIRLFNIPKIQFILFLCLIVISSLVVFSPASIATVLVLSLACSVSVDMLFVILRSHAFIPPYSAIITGLILGLTLHPGMSWIEIVSISSIAIASKHLIRISHRHVFNPAAFGLVIGNVLFEKNVSWWGVSYQHLTPGLSHYLLFLLLFLPVFVSGWRLKRFGIPLSYLIVSIVANVFRGASSPLSILTDPTTIFFAVVMLPEPMTSPVRFTRQILFGGFIALLSIFYNSVPFMSSELFRNLLPDGLLPFLLIGNAVFYKYR